MLVALLVVSSAVGAPLRVDEAIETLSTCDDFQKESCRFAAAWLGMGGDAALPKVLQSAPGMTAIGQILTVSVVSANTSSAATDTLGRLALDQRVGSSARGMALDQFVTRVRSDKKAKSSLDIAIQLAADEDAEIRAGAVSLLASKSSSRDKKVIAALQTASRDADPNVRVEAIAGFATCKCKEAGEVLKRALDDPDLNVRRTAQANQ